MSALRLARRLLLLALLLATGLARAQALNDTYEGLLLPDTFEQPIPITVKLTEMGTLLLGQVKTLAPLPGEAALSRAERSNARCLIFAPVAAATHLRMDGTCVPGLFEGNFLISRNGRDTRGTFSLPRKAPAAPSADPADTPRRAVPVDGTTPLTACLKANTACLIACPRGDYNVEFLCSNRCRTKFQQCKGKSTLQSPAQPASGSAAPPSAN